MGMDPVESVARAIEHHLPRAHGSKQPEVRMTSGADLVPYMALTGKVAHFEIDTLFGFAVKVTVSRT